MMRNKLYLQFDDTVLVINDIYKQSVPNFDQLTKFAEEFGYKFIRKMISVDFVDDEYKAKYFLILDFPPITINTTMLFRILKHKDDLCKVSLIKEGDKVNVYFYNFVDITMLPQYVITTDSFTDIIEEFGEINRESYLVFAPENINVGVYIKELKCKYLYKPAVTINANNYTLMVLFTSNLKIQSITKYFGYAHGHTYPYYEDASLDDLRVPFMSKTEVLSKLKNYVKPLTKKLQLLESSNPHIDKR